MPEYFPVFLILRQRHFETRCFFFFFFPTLKIGVKSARDNPEGSWKMLSVDQLFTNALLQCQTNSWLLLPDCILNWSQDLRSVTSSVPWLPSLRCGMRGRSCPGFSGTPALGFRSCCCDICPALQRGTHYFVFRVGHTLKIV